MTITAIARKFPLNNDQSLFHQDFNLSVEVQTFSTLYRSPGDCLRAGVLYVIILLIRNNIL